MSKVDERSGRAQSPLPGVSEGSVLVFLGPTLPLISAEEELPGAVFLRPASQGDIILAAHAFRPRAMLLIDGQFEDRPPVRHKEILWAMAQGIVMIGAASMGALRAAELCRFGMIGVGLIYRWYRRWPLSPDDAVAVQSAPAELGFLPLTDSMVDLQMTFSRLMRDKRISPEERRSLTQVAKDTNFRERSLQRILCRAGWDAAALKRFQGKMVRQKRLDALQALRSAPQLVADHSRTTSWTWVATNTFVRDLEAGGIDPLLLTTYS